MANIMTLELYSNNKLTDSDWSLTLPLSSVYCFEDRSNTN